MTTAFSTGPGVYAGMTSGHDPSLPPNTPRVYCARIEAYDSPTTEDLTTTFTLLPAMSEGRPDIAKALLALLEVLSSNREAILAQIPK